MQTERSCRFARARTPLAALRQSSGETTCPEDCLLPRPRQASAGRRAARDRNLWEISGLPPARPTRQQASVAASGNSGRCHQTPPRSARRPLKPTRSDGSDRDRYVRKRHMPRAAPGRFGSSASSDRDITPDFSVHAPTPARHVACVTTCHFIACARPTFEPSKWSYDTLSGRGSASSMIDVEHSVDFHLR